MIDIKDFPEGTRINILYTAPITDYYGSKLPPSHSTLNSFAIDKFYNIYNTSNTLYIPLFIDEIDFSEVENLNLITTATSRGYFPSDKFIVNIPKIRNVEFGSLSFQNSLLREVTLNLGEDLEYLSGRPDVSSSTTNTVFTLNSNSNKIKTISLLKPDNYTEFHINCNCENCNPYNSTYSNNTKLTYHSGFPNCKSSMTSNYYDKFANLTYESCISILNNLYDFTGNSVTPSSSQGKLKVHANFLTTVGDELSIGTDKGWTITA